MKKAFLQFQKWDDWYFRIYNKGFSVQPLNSPFHAHLFSVRQAKLQPLHLFKHCWRLLK